MLTSAFKFAEMWLKNRVESFLKALQKSQT